MNSNVCADILQSVLELGVLYPEMRFGQLVEMAALMASEITPIPVAEVGDDALLAAARRHRDHRSRVLSVATIDVAANVSVARRELCQVLQTFCTNATSGRFGYLMAELAANIGETLYDVEDEQLLMATRGDIQPAAALKSRA